jgi:hypothetical protein
MIYFNIYFNNLFQLSQVCILCSSHGTEDRTQNLELNSFSRQAELQAHPLHWILLKAQLLAIGHFVTKTSSVRNIGIFFSE